MCLELSPIESSDHERAPALTGSIAKALLSDGPMWVRVVGLYFDFNATEMVRKEGLVVDEGQFSFIGLRPARHLVMLFDKAGLKTTREVSVRAFDTRVSFDP